MRGREKAFGSKRMGGSIINSLQRLQQRSTTEWLNGSPSRSLFPYNSRSPRSRCLAELISCVLPVTSLGLPPIQVFVLIMNWITGDPNDPILPV